MSQITFIIYQKDIIKPRCCWLHCFVKFSAEENAEGVQEECDIVDDRSIQITPAVLTVAQIYQVQMNLVTAL